MFSFYFTKDDGRRNSKLTLGGADSTLYEGELNYHRVVDKYYWLMKLDNILLGGQDVGLCRDGCRVIADTGTSLITGPTDDLTDLLEKLPVDDNCSGVDDLPDITFVLDGQHYTLTPDEYVMTVTEDGTEETYD